MLQLFKTPVGRLRILGFLEGISLIVLVFIAVPMKYLAGQPSLVKLIGPIHGLLFTFFVITTLSVATTYRWKFSQTSWKVLLACIIPFGTFYIDKHILSRQNATLENSEDRSINAKGSGGIKNNA
jgi:integral membrane protein